MLKTYKYRLYPSKTQQTQLRRILTVARAWYNMCLAERKYAYELEGRSVGKSEQLRQVKHYKRTFPQAANVHSHVLQVATTDLDKAFQAFFRRVKAGEPPGYPRFKGAHRFHSFGFKEYGNGFKLDGRRLKVSGVGRVPARWHRRIPEEGTIKTCRIIHKAGQWFACFSVELPEPEPLSQTGQAVGVDVGIHWLIATSDGRKEPNPNYYRNGQADLRRKQRKLARAKRSGKNRRKALLSVQRQQEHVANQRQDFLNKLVNDLVKDYDLIALEDLRISNMVRNHHLSKSILDSGWGYFAQRLVSKAAEAGREVVFVNPAYTSKTCSNCGAMFEDLKLSDRWVTCACGLSLDRDHNAAINILKRAGRDTSVQLNVDPLPTPNGAGKVRRAVEAARL